jgi:Spy/CpxP family protein refolding chaperone
MNMRKIAFFSASWLIIGVTALTVPSYAADTPVKKPAASQPSVHGMMAPSDEQKECMMGGQMGGKMCDHKGGMMDGQMGGMMCDHKGGMMGGHGAGMMGSPHAHMIMSLDLSDEQRSKIVKLSDELKHDNWATKGLIMDESAKLRDLYAADKRDPSAIGKEYQKIFDLKRKMIEATIASQNRVEEVLTPEQRAQLKTMHRKGAQMDKCPMQH